MGVKNRARFEDDYLLTGHEDGKMVFWILSPNQTIPEEKLTGTSNVYRNNYAKKYQLEQNLISILVPYRLCPVHTAKTPLKLRNSDSHVIALENSPELPTKTLRKNVNLRQINKIYLSADQKRIYSLTVNGELFQWF